MLSFVKSPAELKTDLDKWLYALKHLTEFKERPQYLNGPTFDPLFDLAAYANFNEEERKMYNDSLKHKWDHENVMDYAIKTARDEERAKAEKEKAELQVKAEKEKIEMARKLDAKAEKEKKEMAHDTARQMLAENEPIEKIVRYTKLTVKEIEAL